MRMILDRYSRTRDQIDRQRKFLNYPEASPLLYTSDFSFAITPLLAFSRSVRSRSRSIGIARISAKRYFKQAADELVALIKKKYSLFPPAFFALLRSKIFRARKRSRENALSLHDADTFVIPMCVVSYFTFLEKNTGHESAIDRDYFII